MSESLPPVVNRSAVPPTPDQSGDAAPVDSIDKYWALNEEGNNPPSASQMTELAYAEKYIGRGHGGKVRKLALMSVPGPDKDGPRRAVYNSDFGDRAHEFARADEDGRKAIVESMYQEVINNGGQLVGPKDIQDVKDQITKDLTWATNLRQKGDADPIDELQKNIDDFREIRERRKEAKEAYEQRPGYYRIAAAAGRITKNVAAVPGTASAYVVSQIASRGNNNPRHHMWTRRALRAAGLAFVAWRIKQGASGEEGFVDDFFGGLDEMVGIGDSKPNTVPAATTEMIIDVTGSPSAQATDIEATQSASASASPTPEASASTSATPTAETTTSSTPSASTSPTPSASESVSPSPSTTTESTPTPSPSEGFNDNRPLPSEGNTPAPDTDNKPGNDDKGDETPDTEKAPAGDEYKIGELGDYNKKTGEGTVWHKVMEAAKENGIKFESEKEKHDAVGRALQELGVGGKDATMAERWEAAKSLPDSFGNKGQSFSLENVFGDKYTEVADTAVAKADVEAGPALTGNDIPSAQAKELFSPDINITLEGKNGAELTADMVKENPLYDYYLEAATDMGMTPDQALAELIEGLDIANLYEDAGAKFNENGDVVVPSTMVSGKAVVDPNFAASFNEMVARQVAEEIAKQTKANA